MTIPEASRLVLAAGALAVGGDVFVLDMGDPVLIYDLARRMIKAAGHTPRDSDTPHGDIEIVMTGLRPGEKMYEELMNDEEVRRSYEVEEFFVLLPAFAKNHEEIYPIVKGRQKADRPYNSSLDACMTQAELSDYFRTRSIL